MNFKLTKTTTTPKGNATVQNEGADARNSRMMQFWGNPDNRTFYVIGKLLANEYDGRTLAAILAAGESISMDSLEVENGSVLPLVDGFTLSLASITAWGCIACRSAHGSGVYPSRRVSASLLASCEFYYNPTTKALFTISDTCWGTYVKAYGAARRFIPVPYGVSLSDWGIVADQDENFYDQPTDGIDVIDSEVDAALDAFIADGQPIVEDTPTDAPADSPAVDVVDAAAMLAAALEGPAPKRTSKRK